MFRWMQRAFANLAGWLGVDQKFWEYTYDDFTLSESEIDSQLEHEARQMLSGLTQDGLNDPDATPEPPNEESP